MLLYDLTSTYFEGAMEQNPKAKYGHSRDQRTDCLQLVIALVITPDGFPLAYEVGFMHDSCSAQHGIPGDYNSGSVTQQALKHPSALFCLFKARRAGIHVDRAPSAAITAITPVSTRGSRGVAS